MNNKSFLTLSNKKKLNNSIQLMISVTFLCSLSRVSVSPIYCNFDYDLIDFELKRDEHEVRDGSITLTKQHING